jgi:hypothetical protein
MEREHCPRDAEVSDAEKYRILEEENAQLRSKIEELDPAVKVAEEARDPAPKELLYKLHRAQSLVHSLEEDLREAVKGVDQTRAELRQYCTDAPEEEPEEEDAPEEEQKEASEE